MVTRFKLRVWSLGFEFWDLLFGIYDLVIYLIFVVCLLEFKTLTYSIIKSGLASAKDFQLFPLDFIFPLLRA